MHVNKVHSLKTIDLVARELGKDADCSSISPMDGHRRRRHLGLRG